MNTTNLLIAGMLFIAFLLAGCGAKESPIWEFPEDAQAGDLTTTDSGMVVVPENWDIFENSISK